MNPFRKDYTGWILCPSTRFLGKFYFFNPATGQAVWNLSDMERIMASRPNFTNSDKWHAYPEPDSPPEDTPNSWGYHQPDFLPKHASIQPAIPYQGMHQYSQPYPYFPPNVTEAYPPGIWGMPYPMFMRPGMMNMPRFDPMAQMWGSYGHSSNHFMPENHFCPNPYMHKMPGYNQDLNRYVFGRKPNQNIPLVAPANKGFIQKRRTSADSVNIKEPLFKRQRSQIDFKNDNLFGANNNVFATKSFGVQEKVGKEKNHDENMYKYMLSKQHGHLPRLKSEESLIDIPRDKIDFNYKEHTFPSLLSRSKSMENPTERSSSEISSNFSLKNSFIFPLKKSIKTKTSDVTSETSPKKSVQSSAVAQSGREIKKTVVGEDSDNNLSETDLRHLLMERRRKSSLGAIKETEKEKGTAKKIKTSYTKEMIKESPCKKHVTFNLGVEGSLIDAQDADNGDTEMCADEYEPYDEGCVQTYVIPDTEALMKDLDVLEELVKLEPSHVLFIADSVRSSIEAVSGESGGSGAGARRRVTAARNVARRIAQTHAHIQVQFLDPSSAVEGTSDPLIDCCLQLYEEGYNPILISDNDLLLFKASDLEIECYQTEEIKKHVSTLQTAVSFDIEKTDDKGLPISTIPVTATRKQVFQKSNNSNQFFLDKETENANTQTSKYDNKNIRHSKNISVTNQKSFFDKDIDLLKETTKEIEKLNLHDVDVHYRDALAGKKQRSEKENANVFKDNDEAMEENFTAKKKIIKSINVYNLDGHLKSFSIKSKEMEEGIRNKMDEYFCCFSQIMETVFLDMSKDMPIPGCESSLTPFQSSLHYMREIFGDHRTATLLIDKLGSILDKAHTLINGRLTLSLEPQEFLKMFGCGTLLITVLRSILPSESALAEGERLLSLLERRIEQWGEGEQSPPHQSPSTPHTTHTTHTEHRDEFVKNPAEVLVFLSKHFQDYQQPSHDKQRNNTELKVNQTVKVVRTTGRNVGLLKLDPGKPLTLDDRDERSCDDYKETNKDEEKAYIKNKAKVIRKLAIESLNLPPKMKEIDVQKRENIDKECAKLLEEMVTCSSQQKPITKFYNLRSIIVDNSKKTDSKDKITFSKQVSQSNNKIDSTTKTIKPNNHNSKEINNNQERQPLNLDAFDYSDIQESTYSDEKVESNESSNKQLVGSDNSNYVTTTQRSDNEVSPNNNSDRQNNSSNENSDKTNDGDIRNNNNYIDNVENYDSGIESEQANYFVQHFLTNLSSSFRSIKQFIESSACKLKSRSDARTNERIRMKAAGARDIVSRIINNLDLISERESNLETSVSPVLARGETQVGITNAKYRLVISRCAVSARVLHDALKMLTKLTTHSQSSHTELLHT